MKSNKIQTIRKLSLIFVFLASGILILGFFNKNNNDSNFSTNKFNGERAYADIEYQLSLGPRTPGSTGHDLILDWIQVSLEEQDWFTDIQVSESMGHPIKNIIAKRGSGDLWILIGAHFDSRIRADKDKIPENRNLPVPGANDGASGVALLLELARVLPHDLPIEIWLVFFDAEDNGNIDGWDWILGSKNFVNGLEIYPDNMILVDMVGDKDLQIFMEKNSNPYLLKEIWDIAARLGYSKYFIPTYKHALLDDHIPFIQAGVPSVNIIDFDYPYWHTVDDTLDKLSSGSLQIVGSIVLTWLESLQ